MRTPTTPDDSLPPLRQLGRRPRALPLLTAMAVIMLTAACSSASTGGEATNHEAAGSVEIAGRRVSVDKTLAAEVPAPIRSAGVLKNISYNNAPPDEYVVDGELVGWNVDLGRAVAATLGLTWQSEASDAFDTFIPSLQNGRYDTAFTALFYTPERAKVVDLVTYLNAGTGFLTKTGSPISVNVPTDLCGHVVSFIPGNSFSTKVPGIDALCTAAGKPPVTVQTYATFSSVLLALASGRTEIAPNQSTGVAAVVKNAKNQFTGQPLVYLPSPEGVAVTKNIGLTKPIADAIDTLITSGVYKAILDKWDVRDGLVTKTTIHDS